MGNACYYSVEKLLSFSLLSKNLKVRIYKTVILPIVLYGCETWTLTLREEHREYTVTICGISPEYYSKTHYRVKVCKVYFVICSRIFVNFEWIMTLSVVLGCLTVESIFCLHPQTSKWAIERVKCGRKLPEKYRLL
ncbi:hypothetical protein ANN_22759 [Periplaneta americana]|uniref:Uncharacterized protein n=1 Tax=Periplaneta americana TaxID=6978 RepID=A0ABQ8SKH6_PERAM|nr:hypothetical protein ANN_22759 [Periplaneta americana]